SSLARRNILRETRLHQSGEAVSSDLWWVICALGYALEVTLSLNGYSLWTDEAFTAWLASHDSFSSLCRSLLAGDSSDLQMGLYHVYLFFWTRLCGTGEL